MKLSSISLVGAALAAIVVSIIAAPVPHSLEQVNLFERDVDGLVDGLFTRADSHGKLASAHEGASLQHQAASQEHKRAGDELQRVADDTLDSERAEVLRTQSVYHFGKANQHGREAVYHDKQYELNVKAEAAGPDRTMDQKALLSANPSARRTAVKNCRDDAKLSKVYATAVIDYLHGGPKPGPFTEPPCRHSNARIL